MTMQSVLNDIIKATVTPILKQHGFKRSGNNFYKDLGKLGWCCQVQSSSWNTADAVQFTLNAGIFISQLHTVFYNEPQPKFPKEYHCLLRKRISQLKGQEADIWYKLSDKTDVVQVKTDLAQDVEVYVLPYLFQFLTLSSVLECVLMSQEYEAPMKVAILLYLNGNQDECRRLIHEEYSAATESQREFIREASDRIGIPLI